MLKVFDLIRQVASLPANVFITGESGTGKELVAKAIHYSGSRKTGPFVPVSCSAIPETLIESELFGYERGAFTGAIRSKPGLFEIAAQGTIFLDEITELPPSVQVALLRAIQERKVRRVGGTREIEIDVRFIAATNRDPESVVKSGQFREDLYYRLNVIRIDLPPLRERKEDIPILLEHFLNNYAHRTQKRIPTFSPEAIRLLQEYSFPGNVRELENLTERILAVCSAPVIHPQDLMPHLARAREETPSWGMPSQGINLEQQVSDFEKKLILQALAQAGGKKTRAAELLGISFRSLRYKLAKYHLNDKGGSGEVEEKDEEEN